ncbi:MAG: hypothetical protein ACETVZ_00245 [Phycisphaerae bacterium]
MAKTKIIVNTTVKRCTKKKGCFSIAIGDVKLTEGQRNELDGLIDDAEQVKLTIEVEQEKLPGMK